MTTKTKSEYQEEEVKVTLSDEVSDIQMEVTAPRSKLNHVSLSDVFAPDVLNYQSVKVDNIEVKND